MDPTTRNPATEVHNADSAVSKKRLLNKVTVWPLRRAALRIPSTTPLQLTLLGLLLQIPKLGRLMTSPSRLRARRR
jgi:hypothetical protein